MRRQSVPRIDPAYSVVQALGADDVAVACRVCRSQVWRWTVPSGRHRGTDGLVPIEYWPALLRLAKSKQVALSVFDLLPPELRVPPCDVAAQQASAS